MAICQAEYNRAVIELKREWDATEESRDAAMQRAEAAEAKVEALMQAIEAETRKSEHAHERACVSRENAECEHGNTGSESEDAYQARSELATLSSKYQVLYGYSLAFHS